MEDATSKWTELRALSLDSNCRIGAYIIISKLVGIFGHDKLRLDESFVTDWFKKNLELMMGDFACTVLDYNGLYTLGDLYTIVIDFVKVGLMNADSNEIEYAFDTWHIVEDKIYEQDPLCSKRKPYKRNNIKRHPHAKPVTGKMA